MTISGSKVLIAIDGLPEMPIQGLRISNVIGSGKVGMTANYTDGLELHNVQLNPESGPAFRATRATNLELDHVTTRKPLAGMPVVRIEKSPGAILRDSRAFSGTGTFLSTPKGQLKDVILQGNIMNNATKPTEETDPPSGR
jgi:hypothetical protein